MPAGFDAARRGDLSRHSLTNVVYNVQTSTNLAMWATPGNVPDPRTNFSFTNWKTGALQFYRLAVP
jgi:hypothetical protein